MVVQQRSDLRTRTLTLRATVSATYASASIGSFSKRQETRSVHLERQHAREPFAPVKCLGPQRTDIQLEVRSCPDIVAKVENRTTLKISRKLIFRLLCCCLAIQRRYEGPWSILDETIWSLTSPRVNRISGSKKFRSSPQKDFFNSIGATRTWAVTSTSVKWHFSEVTAAGTMSVSCRYCCKSRKSNNPKNLAKVDLWTSLLPRRFSTQLRRSVIDFG